MCILISHHLKCSNLFVHRVKCNQCNPIPLMDFLIFAAFELNMCRYKLEKKQVAFFGLMFLHSVSLNSLRHFQRFCIFTTKVTGNTKKQIHVETFGVIPTGHALKDFSESGCNRSEISPSFWFPHLFAGTSVKHARCN